MKQPRSLSSTIVVFALAAACARHSGEAVSVTVGGVPLFETRLEIPTGTGLHADYHVADFDGDNVLDMAVASLSGELRVLLGNGAGFNIGQELQIGGLPIWMAGGDFDNDGDVDIVVVRNDADETNVWRNDGSGTFTMAGTLAVGADALAVAVGDLDGDGNLDVAVSRPQAPEIVVGFGDGQLGFGSVAQLGMPGGGTAFNLSYGDADGDQRGDLVVADSGFSRLIVFSGTEPGVAFGTPRCTLDVPGTPGAVTFGDLSGDGVDDMVVSAFTQNRYVVITDVSDPATQPTGAGGVPDCSYQSFEIPVPAQPALAKVGDVTGDGRNDLVACFAFQASVGIAPGTANGIGELEVLDATGQPLRPFIGDFDNNGRDDVSVLSGLADRVNLWLARDSGPLAGARSFATTLPEAAWLEGADFDGDGDFEVVTGSNADPRLVLMGGNGRLDIEATIDIGAGVYQLHAADLDFDGRQDLIVGVSGGIKVLHNVSTPGSYAFDVMPASPGSLGSGSFPFGMEVADLDRDADLDIVFCDFVGGGLHIVPGTATPFAFDAELVLNVGGGPVDVAAADFTGDGWLDLAVSRLGQADVAILRNEGGSQFVESLSIPVGQSPNYLVTSDFDNDGRADLVVSNASSGTVTVLAGDGVGFVGHDFAAGALPTALLAQDLTGDGVDDILVASLRSGDFRVLVGDGQGGFPLLPSFPGTFGASDVVLQDMTGDGEPELLISSLVTDRVSLVRNLKQ